jgi:hypothetical protein
MWMHRKPAPLEWSLPGYPGSYLQQLQLKSGNHPELGMAKWTDIPARLSTNLMAESDILLQLVLRHGVNQTKVAVVIIPIYELIYLLWPWTMDPRFLLPIAPLACYYVWQGIRGLISASRAKPRVVGILWLPAALLLALSGAYWIYIQRVNGKGDLPDQVFTPLWLISAGCAAWMAYTGKSIFSLETSSSLWPRLKQPLTRWRGGTLHLLRYASYLITISLVSIGIGIANRSRKPERRKLGQGWRDRYL